MAIAHKPMPLPAIAPEPPRVGIIRPVILYYPPR
jgi:hypothetical protein